MRFVLFIPDAGTVLLATSINKISFSIESNWHISKKINSPIFEVIYVLSLVFHRFICLSYAHEALFDYCSLIVNLEISVYKLFNSSVCFEIVSLILFCISI